MYPSVLVSRPHSNDYPADTDMFMLLGNMMNGTRRPQNVLTDLELDPYTVAPWNLPPKVLYFIQSDREITTTEGGYWHIRTQLQSSTMGRVTTLNFYKGQAPRGDKTYWVMKKYTMDKLLGSSSLCIVFEEQQLAVADDADGGLLQAMLISMLEHDENMPQVIPRNELGPPVICGSHLQNLRPDYDLVPGEAFDFSEEGFLEWNDIVGSASPSSTSENTCISSMRLDDYFDPEDMLREIGTSSIPDTNKQNVDRCRVRASAPRESHQVFVQPPPSGSLGGSTGNNNKNPLVMKTVFPAFAPSSDHIGGLNHTNPPPAASVDHPPAATVDELRNRKIVGRITKLAKKYFCFM